MEGAVLAGKLAAEVVVDRAMGAPGRPDKNIIAEVHAAAESKVAPQHMRERESETERCPQQTVVAGEVDAAAESKVAPQHRERVLY